MEELGKMGKQGKPDFIPLWRGQREEKPCLVFGTGRGRTYATDV